MVTAEYQMAEVDKMQDIRIGPVGRGQTTPKCRILYDIPCKVCQDHSSGKHYGIFACDGCAGFFKRSIRRNRQYMCKSKADGGCMVDKTHRNQCRSCRLTKCVQAGMNKDAVQHERGPRNSTLRRQMSLYFKESSIESDSSPTRPRSLTPPPVQNSTPSSTTLPHISPQPPPPIHFSHLASLPFSFPHFSPSFKLSPTSFPPLPIGRTDLPRPPPELTALALNRVQGLTSTRHSTLLAPTPKYPHELIAPLLSPHETVSESAVGLLFMNIRWAKSLPAFTALPIEDQVLLLEESWRELFVLSATQFPLPVEAGQLLTSSGFAGESTERLLPLLQDIKLFQETSIKFKNMAIDATEYAYLKAIVLFKTVWEGGPGDTNQPRDLNSINILQDQAQLILNKYISSTYLGQPFRFGKFLLLLPSLKAVGSKSIEELFFKRTLGSIPIQRIIADMFK